MSGVVLIEVVTFHDALQEGAIVGVRSVDTGVKIAACACYTSRMTNAAREPKVPDNGTIIAKLQNLLQACEVHERHGPAAFRTADFEVWQTEVFRWLKYGQPYTDSQYHGFIGLRFVLGDWETTLPGEKWQNGLKQAEYLLTAAIEQLTQEWAIPHKAPPAKTGTPPNTTTISPTIINTNANLQLNVTVATALEQIGREIQKVDPAEGKRFWDRINKLAENPIFKTLLESGLGAILKQVGGG